MTSGAAAGNADSIGVNVPPIGIRPNEPTGAMHEPDDVAYLIAGLRAVEDSEDRVTMIGVRTGESLLDLFVARLPTATDDLDDADPVRIFRREDIHGQGNPFGSEVDDVALTFHLSEQHFGSEKDKSKYRQ
ncbi:MAG: hypothetical protein ACI9OD_000839 [Limisphaerales bacterium]|jgi:hypothetical protein